MSIDQIARFPAEIQERLLERMASSQDKFVCGTFEMYGTSQGLTPLLPIIHYDRWNDYIESINLIESSGSKRNGIVRYVQVQPLTNTYRENHNLEFLYVEESGVAHRYQEVVFHRES